MYRVSIESGAAAERYVPTLERAVATTLEHEGAPANSEVTVALVDEEKITELNREYRGVAGATDVLSFEMQERLPDGSLYLGDVIVCLPIAERQAGEQGHNVVAELSLLVIHGVLHLLGDDHAREDDREAMWAKQSALLAKLGLRASPSERSH